LLIRLGRFAMKKNTILLIFLSACLIAADFWQTKPFSEWSDKDAHKVIENSPWAKTFQFDDSSTGGCRRTAKRKACRRPMSLCPDSEKTAWAAAEADGIAVRMRM